MNKLNLEILNNITAASITAITAATAIKWGGRFIVILSTTSLIYTVVTAVACYVVAKTIQELFNEYAFKGSFEGAAFGVVVQGGLFVAGTYFGLISSEQISPIASVVAAMALMMNNFWNVSTQINSKIEEEKNEIVTKPNTETSGNNSIEFKDDINIDAHELKIKEKEIKELKEKILQLNQQIEQLKLNPENDKNKVIELEKENNELFSKNEMLKNQVSRLDEQLIQFEQVKEDMKEFKLQFIEKEVEEERLKNEVQLLQQEKVTNLEITKKNVEMLKIKFQKVLKKKTKLTLNLTKTKEELDEIKKLLQKTN